ncbi:MAG: glycosyltransferase family 4 protein [Rikenellaceae bacterium]
MNIAIITTGILPVPAVHGGAVETLTDFLIEYNEHHSAHQITLYGTYDKRLDIIDFSSYKNTTFSLIDNSSFVIRIKRKLFGIAHKNFYYNYFLDFFIKETCKKIAKQNYDLIVVENRPGFILPLKKITKAKLCLHLHYDSLYKGAKLAREILNACDGIITVSNYIKKRVCTIDNKCDKVKVVYNGIDLDKFKTRINLCCSRKQFGIDNKDFVILYCGRIEPIKGVRELIMAFASIEAYSDMKLLIVGGSSNLDSFRDTYLQNIQAVAKPLANRVIFAGYQQYNSIPSILKLCDISVIPSICEEALPLSAIESLASGLPLIITKSGGMPEIVNDECAIIIEKGDNLVNDLANSIISLYNDKEKRLKMSASAVKQSNKFGKDRFASEFFKTLCEF